MRVGERCGVRVRDKVEIFHVHAQRLRYAFVHLGRVRSARQAGSGALGAGRAGVGRPVCSASVASAMIFFLHLFLEAVRAQPNKQRIQGKMIRPFRNS